jgi:hypothetical protein
MEGTDEGIDEGTDGATELIFCDLCVEGDVTAQDAIITLDFIGAPMTCGELETTLAAQMLVSEEGCGVAQGTVKDTCGCAIPAIA